MEIGNPPPITKWPYVVTVIGIPIVSLVGVVLVVTLRPATSEALATANAALVTQILGFGATITVAMLAYLKSSDTHIVMNSRMDEFKRTMQLASDAAVARALSEGRAEGRASADARTDVLSEKTDQVRQSVSDVNTLLKTHDEWEQDRLRDERK